MTLMQTVGALNHLYIIHLLVPVALTTGPFAQASILVLECFYVHVLWKMAIEFLSDHRCMYMYMYNGHMYVCTCTCACPCTHV